MGQSLSKLYLHIIFYIKTKSAKIRPQEKPDLCAYIASIIKDRQSIPIIINGTENHLHILCVMSKNIALADFMEDIKKYSSRWIKTKNDSYKSFAWQGGYAGFSVSPSLQEKTRNYIERQEEHHKKLSFQEEYLLFLKEYGIDYNEDFLWRD